MQETRNSARDGFAGQRRGSGRRKHAAAALAFFLCCLTGRGADLTSAFEVRSLSFDDAEAGKPVDLEATVIFTDPPSTVFIQDETAGTFFRLEGADPPSAGDRIRLRGRTFPGLYLPGVENTSFEILGRTELPRAIPVTVEDLESGAYHYQLVTTEGLVRSAEPADENSSVLRIAIGSRILRVRVDLPLSSGFSWIGRTARITGLAAGEINHRRQLVEPHLRCRDWSAVALLSPPVSDEVIPRITAEELLTFRAAPAESRNLVRLRGVVLAGFSGGPANLRTLYLRDGGISVSVSVRSGDEEVRPGDRVDVAGFPEMRLYSASLADARILEVTRGTTPPSPIPVTWDELRQGDHDGDLVSIVGELADWYPSPEDITLLLRSPQRNFSALVRLEGFEKDLSPGMELEVTGICQVDSTRHSGYRSLPESILLRARSEMDVRILQAPAWWTARRLAWAASFLGLVILLAGLWILLLKIQVARQTSDLRRSIEKEAALEERQRIAREFHDTLEQELAGLSIRLDAATAQVKGERLARFLKEARHLVSRIQTETRNLVADLREPSGDTGGLQSELDEIFNTDLPPGHPVIEVAIDDDFSPGNSRARHHLKMIAREAVTNALKHGAPKRIRVSGGAEEDRMILRIDNDGRPFDVDHETRGKAGHFGCVGMRERARKIGAEIEWTSGENGTSVIVTL